MGIIQKQSIRSSVFISLGFAIGAFNILLLFPRFLPPEYFGLTRAMLDIALTLSLLCTVGSLPVIYKFFPFYNHYLTKEKNDLPLITGIVCVAGFILVMFGGWVFKDFIIRKLGKSPELATYFYMIYPFTFFMLAFIWMESFSWGLKMTVISNFLRETAVRIIGTILILLYGFRFISLHVFIHLFSLMYLVPAIILLMVLVRTRRWKIAITWPSKVTRRLQRRMISFGLFIFGAQFLNLLAKTNDTFLVFGIEGLAQTGVFAIATYMTAIMEIPQRSLNSISTPVLSESWKNNDLKNIEHVYRKSVTNLLVIALGLFGLIYLNAYNLASFLGKEYAQIGIVIFIMGFAKVIELGTGINGIIIGTSNYWKFDFYTNVFYTIFSLPLNFFLIKSFGLPGLAVANLIS
ncbi:MAG: hypothetical protein H7X99_03960, partial [Saprospiraceae bacterium]|nr:hypothetical protein [Saprospiraceae bacterium]